MDPIIIWLTSDFTPTDESHAAMGKVIDGDKIYFILPGAGARELHMGPGDHPSGSSQDVHGHGGGGGDGSKESSPPSENYLELFPDPKAAQAVKEQIESVREHGLATGNEKIVFLGNDGSWKRSMEGGKDSVNTTLDDFRTGDISVHNHPSSTAFSMQDLASFMISGDDQMVVAAHNGDVFVVGRTEKLHTMYGLIANKPNLEDYSASTKEGKIWQAAYSDLYHAELGAIDKTRKDFAALAPAHGPTNAGLIARNTKAMPIVAEAFGFDYRYYPAKKESTE